MSEKKNVFQLITEVTKSLSESGIAKKQENKFDKYLFRGIDDVFNAMSPILAEVGLNIIPSVIDRHTNAVQAKSGGHMYHTILTVEYTLVSSIDGTTHKTIMQGESMDRSDKSINKAFQQAYKYMCLQLFCVPLDSKYDADEETLEIKNDKFVDTSPVRKTGNRTIDKWVNNACMDIQAQTNLDDLRLIYMDFMKQAKEKGVTEEQLDLLTDAKDMRKGSLENGIQ